METKKIKDFMAGVFGLVIILLVLKLFLGSEEPPSEPVAAPEIVKESEPEVEAKVVPEINLKIAVDAIKDYPGVRDAAVSQKGWEMSLSIIVGHAVTEKRAKELGDNFVRMVMTNAGSDFEKGPEGKEIGRSRFSYLVGVYRPDETRVALGAKAPAAKWISW